NETLMQFQSDILDVPVVRPKVKETTALGAAYAAGLAVGVWSNLCELRSSWAVDQQWNPTMPEKRREHLYGRWKEAVNRTLNWEDSEN
ncbi:MAG TPA: glycerol kinase, partial [Chloroflexi bacterium]|nr:glycerol kinase [Chloroflexota bacterium]